MLFVTAVQSHQPRNRVVVLCGHGKESLQLDRFCRTHISEEFEAKCTRLIANSNDAAAAPVAQFIQKHSVPFPIYLDIEQTTNTAMVRHGALPSTVIDDAGRQLHRLPFGQLD